MTKMPVSLDLRHSGLGMASEWLQKHLKRPKWLIMAHMAHKEPRDEPGLKPGPKMSCRSGNKTRTGPGANDPRKIRTNKVK